jgi:hypothetical protein
MNGVFESVDSNPMHFHHDRADIIKLFLINPPKNRVSKLSISFCTANPCPQTVPVILLTTKKMA